MNKVPFLLSDSGSDRATAYNFANKVVTREGKTHAVWADTILVPDFAPQTMVRGRSFDHELGVWGDALDLGWGVDNHTSPALSCDAEGRLRIAFGPHGCARWAAYPDEWPMGTFKFAVGKEFNALDFEEPVGLGYSATYACLQNTADGQDVLVYRGGEYPPVVMFQRSRELGGWTQAKPLMHQEIPPGYTFYAAQVASDRYGKLYVGANFYSAQLGRSDGIALLTSKDQGRSWEDLRGLRVATPSVYSASLAVPQVTPHLNPYLWTVLVGHQDRLWTLTGSPDIGSRAILLGLWQQGEWRTWDLDKYLREFDADRVAVQGVCSVDTLGRIHVAVAALSLAAWRAGDAGFGHNSCEIIYLSSSDEGESFNCRQLSSTDPEEPNWLPSIAQPGPHHPVETPLILWTNGKSHRETGGRTSTRTNVFAVFACS